MNHIVSIPMKIAISALFLFLLDFPLAAQQPNAGLEMRSLEDDGQGNQRTTPGLLQDTAYQVHVSGPIVSLTVRQSFTNASPYFMEGLYRFPLPDDASVHGFSFEVGDRLTKGVVKEKKKAEAAYKKAVKEGKRAALLREHRPNIFSTLIGNIPPGETITVIVELVSLATLSNTDFQWFLPSAIMPRYTGTQRGLPATGDETDKLFLGSELFYDLEGESKRAQFSATFSRPDAIQSIYLNGDAADASPVNGLKTITPETGFVPMDRDLMLSWQLKSAADVTSITFAQNSDGDDYIMSLIVPPKAQKTAPKRPRDLIFILDTSGSMYGDAIQQAREGLATALETLGDQDRFDIIEFNDRPKAFAGRFLEATFDHKRQAANWVKSLEADGGTQMAPAFSAALEKYDRGENRLQQIVFLTDGAVSEEKALFRYLADNLNNTRLFTIAVGPAPNSWFMRKSAEIGRGSFARIVDYQHVETTIADLMETIAAPHLIDVKLSHSENSFPTVQPDLYGNKAHMVIFKTEEGQGTRTLKGTDVKGKPWSTTLSPLAADTAKGLDKIWARKKIESLIDQQTLEGKSDENRDEMVAVSVKHQVLSPATRFIAVDQKIVRKPTDPLGRQIVKSSLPKGAKPALLFAPQSALGLGVKTSNALWFLMIAGVLIGSTMMLTRIGRNSG